MLNQIGEEKLKKIKLFLSPYKNLKIKASDKSRHAIVFKKTSMGFLSSYEIAIHKDILNLSTPSWTTKLLIKVFLLKIRNKEIPKLFLEKLSELISSINNQRQLSLVKPRPAQNETFAKIKNFKQFELEELWSNLRQQYFPENPKLNQYRIIFSKRHQTRCLASCDVYSQTVRVAKAMKHPEALIHLEALLYHEMCHAHLGKPRVVNGRRIMHGRDFKELEKRHPQIKRLDLWIKSGGWSKVVRETRTQ